MTKPFGLNCANDAIMGWRGGVGAAQHNISSGMIWAKITSSEFIHTSPARSLIIYTAFSGKCSGKIRMCVIKNKDEDYINYTFAV